MFTRILGAGVTATCATAAVVIGKAHQQSLHSEAIAKTNDTVVLKAGVSSNFDLEVAKDAARELVVRKKEECGAPGVTVAVSKNGRLIWAEGFGYADVENLTLMTPRHVLRIASISKPMTMALVGRAMDQGQLDVTASVHHYLPHYPRHVIDGEPVDMTVDQVATHRAGIRHYDKKPEVDAMKKKRENSKKNKLAHEVLSEQEDNSHSTSVPQNKPAIAGSGDGVSKKSAKSADAVKSKTSTEKKPEKSKSERELAKIAPANEMHTAVKYENVGDALTVFKNDELIHKPGSGFHYSTHGYTLLSAVLEAATGTRFSDLLHGMFHAMDLRSTYLDENETIIRNRAKYYVRSGSGRLQNAPHVDNSWKIAGGGLLSTPSDLCRFGDTMLYSWQVEEATQPAGYLRPETARWLWTAPDEPAGAAGRRRWSPHRYARGWQLRRAEPELGVGPGAARVTNHTGGATGCSSILLVRPDGTEAGGDGYPRGVTVAAIVNTEGVGLTGLADDIARLFAN